MTARWLRSLLRPFVCSQCMHVCDDCGICSIDELYMLEDDVWYSVADGHVLCVGCVERRLGRRLVSEDFDPDAPCNYDPQSARLESRLGGRFGHVEEPV